MAATPLKDGNAPAAFKTGGRSWWPARGTQATAARSDRQAGEAGRPKRTSMDVLLVAGGIALGLTSAFFPWYVFMNQDQFGIRAVKFGGNPATGTQPASATPAGHINAPIPLADAMGPPLDRFTTGTLPRTQDEPNVAGPVEQPFPSSSSAFKLVHIVNGRAMIEDGAGLWIVQPGSVLPDNTRVTSIEQRAGRWVLVTTGDRVVEIAR